MYATYSPSPLPSRHRDVAIGLYGLGTPPTHQHQQLISTKRTVRRVVWIPGMWHARQGHTRPRVLSLSSYLCVQALLDLPIDSAQQVCGLFSITVVRMWRERERERERNRTRCGGAATETSRRPCFFACTCAVVGDGAREVDRGHRQWVPRECARRRQNRKKRAFGVIHILSRTSQRAVGLRQYNTKRHVVLKPLFPRCVDHFRGTELPPTLSRLSTFVIGRTVVYIIMGRWRKLSSGIYDSSSARPTFLVARPIPRFYFGATQ